MQELAPQIIWKGFDNELVIAIAKHGAAYPLAANGITKVAVKVGSQLFDSEAHPDAVGFADNIITANVGALITSGLGRVPLRVILYDAAHPNGILWKEFQFEIK